MNYALVTMIKYKKLIKTEGGTYSNPITASRVSGKGFNLAGEDLRGCKPSIQVAGVTNDCLSRLSRHPTTQKYNINRNLESLQIGYELVYRG